MVSLIRTHGAVQIYIKAIITTLSRMEQAQLACLLLLQQHRPSEPQAHSLLTLNHGNQMMHEVLRLQDNPPVVVMVGADLVREQAHLTAHQTLVKDLEMHQVEIAMFLAT